MAETNVDLFAEDAITLQVECTDASGAELVAAVRAGLVPLHD
jgi:ribonuclease PH